MASDYRSLTIARDHAAYRAVGAIDAALCYARQGDVKMVLSILASAKENYERAAKTLDNFTSNPKKENPDGNAAAA